MFKDVLNHANLTLWAEAGLVVFFLVFVGVAVWTFTRSRKQVEEWSAIPLSGGREESEAYARLREMKGASHD